MRKRKTPLSRDKASRPRPLSSSSSSSSGATSKEVTARMQPSIPVSDLASHLERMPGFSVCQISAPSPPRFQMKLFEASNSLDALPSFDDGEEDVCSDKDGILSQDFFCSADYITPEMPNNLNSTEEDPACPKSPEKSIRNKRRGQDCSPCIFPSTTAQLQEDAELKVDEFGSDDVGGCNSEAPGLEKKQRYVSQSAVALRCQVMPPPCIKNPYLNDNSSIAHDIFADRMGQMTGFFPSVGGDGISRYRTDFHEIEQIGSGYFSHVFKALKRMDGCLYAVKRSIKQFRSDIQRRYALREVQALAALGYHENIVGYYNSWFENDKLYIQMELCECSLSNGYLSRSGDVLKVLYQIANALYFMHDRGIVHMDVKPDNIYVKYGVYKLGDFGRAILADKSLSIEEGDSRYMPREILNDEYENLDKVDIFSLGVATYELVKGSQLPEYGPLFSNLREGKIPLLPGWSVQFQSLLKAMMDPDPVKRPSARQILGNSIFEKVKKTASRNDK